MLDPGPDEAGRDVLAQDVRARIEAKGTLKHENKWGLRKMAYEIDKRNEADYRWFRFEASNELLDDLGHSLRIADGVLRFRIFKVDVDAPVLVPPAVAAPVQGASRDRDRGPQGARPATVPAEADEDDAGDDSPAEVVEVTEVVEVVDTVETADAVETVDAPSVDEPAAAE
jgi:small subunit ribosomal protein S6